MKKWFVLPLLVCLALVSLALPAEKEEGKVVSEGMGIAGYQVIVESCSVKTSECFSETIHNVVTNNGKDAIEEKIGGGAANATTFNIIAVGNSSLTPAAASTNLGTGSGGEIAEAGLNRAGGTFMNQGTSNGNWSISKQFSVTGTAYVNITGVFNSTTANATTMLSAATFTARSLANGDTLNITVVYSIT